MKNKVTGFSFIIIAFLAVLAVSFLFGGTGIPLQQLFQALINPEGTDAASTILWKIRFPRILLGLLVGAGLASSGCVMQSIIRNPLADPYTLGISGGAAFGAALSIVTGFAGLNIFFLPGCSFLGTLISTFIVYTISSFKNFSKSTLILTGVILGLFFSSLVLLIFSLSDAQKLHSTVMWIMGDLSSYNPGLTAIAGTIIGAGILIIMVFSRELDLLTLGEEKAFHLGMNTKTVTQILFLTSSLIVGACVAVSGIIGFVGLVIPHLARGFTGPKHIYLVPASAVLGSAFLILSDTIARTVISPVELPVGVITGLIGGGFILVFLTRKSNNRIF